MPSPDYPMAELSFTAFVVSLASTAAIHFGDLADPATGETLEPNLEGAAQMIDILALLEEKTRGNLTAEERQVLEQVLYELGSASSRPAARPAHHPAVSGHARAAVRSASRARHGHVARRAGHRLRLRRVPIDRSARPADAAVDPDRAAGDGDAATATAPLPARSATSSSTRPPICARRRSRTTSAAWTRSCSRTATPITSSASTRCGGSTRCSGRRFRAMRDARTLADLRRMFAYIFEPPRQHGGGVPQLALFRHRRPVLARRRRGRARARDARPAADPRVPHRLVRVPDRLQRIPDASWRAARRRAHAGARRAARAAALARISASIEALDVVARLVAERAYFTHIAHDLATPRPARGCPPGVELAYDGQVLEIRG